MSFTGAQYMQAVAEIVLAQPGLEEYKFVLDKSVFIYEPFTQKFVETAHLGATPEEILGVTLVSPKVTFICANAVKYSEPLALAYTTIHELGHAINTSLPTKVIEESHGPRWQKIVTRLGVYPDPGNHEGTADTWKDLKNWLHPELRKTISNLQIPDEMVMFRMKRELDHIFDQWVDA